MQVQETWLINTKATRVSRLSAYTSYCRLRLDSRRLVEVLMLFDFDWLTRLFSRSSYICFGYSRYLPAHKYSVHKWSWVRNGCNVRLTIFLLYFAFAFPSPFHSPCYLHIPYQSTVLTSPTQDLQKPKTQVAKAKQTKKTKISKRAHKTHRNPNCPLRIRNESVIKGNRKKKRMGK